MGFGHRVYKNGDSRVPTMKAALDSLIREKNAPEMGELYDALESAMEQRKGIKPNLDYPSGPGISPDRLRHADLHPAVRREPHHRMDGAHHGTDGIQHAHPAAERV